MTWKCAYCLDSTASWRWNLCSTARVDLPHSTSAQLSFTWRNFPIRTVRVVAGCTKDRESNFGGKFMFRCFPRGAKKKSSENSEREEINIVKEKQKRFLTFLMQISGAEDPRDSLFEWIAARKSEWWKTSERINSPVGVFSNLSLPSSSVFFSSEWEWMKQLIAKWMRSHLPLLSLRFDVFAFFFSLASSFRLAPLSASEKESTRRKMRVLRNNINFTVARKILSYFLSVFHR